MGVAMTKSEIIEAAKKLDEADREDVVEELLLSLPGDYVAYIEAAWLTEAKRRSSAYDAGEMSASPVEEVIARVLSKARK
jgi:putative addiction module component (TIGR02574 family)